MGAGASFIERWRHRYGDRHRNNHAKRPNGRDGNEKPDYSVYGKGKLEFGEWSNQL